MATLRTTLFTCALSAALTACSGCGGNAPSPAPRGFEVPALAASSAPPAATILASASPPPFSAPSGAPRAAAATPIAVRFRILDQEFVESPAGGHDRFHVTLELAVMTEPPQRIAIGVLREPGCRLAYDGAELGEGPRVAGGLVCYYAGYGDYVRITDDGDGHFSVSTYGQSESVVGNESPPHEHARRLGRVTLPEGARPVFELVEPDGGLLP